MNTNHITFEALFSRAATTIDGAWKVSLDTLDVEAVMKLSEMKSKRLQIAVVVIEEGVSSYDVPEISFDI